MKHFKHEMFQNTVSGLEEKFNDDSDDSSFCCDETDEDEYVSSALTTAGKLPTLSSSLNKNKHSHNERRLALIERMKLGNKRKRLDAFTDTDRELLITITKKHSNVINNSKTGGITPRMKTEVT